MVTQTLTFVVLPNGIASDGALKLSIYLSPRLDGAAQLSSFSDILHWTAQTKAHGLKFKLTDGTHSTIAAVPTAQLRPDIWSTIFKSDTLVQPYTNPDYTKRLFVSYPARDAMAFAKYAYQLVGANVLNAATGDRQSMLNTVLENLVFRDGPTSTLRSALSALRISMWKQQNRDTSSGIAIIAKTITAQRTSTAADGIPTTGTEPATTRDMIQRFALFHHMAPAHHRPPLPSKPADFAKLLDFHKALTAINSYPVLLRALGLVFDVEIPAASLENSPATSGSSYRTVAVEALTPGFKWKLNPQLFLPPTAYLKNTNQFASAPVTSPSSLASKNYSSGDVIDGFMNLAPDGFHLTQIDLDGALLKALSLADSIAFADYRNSTVANGVYTEVEQVMSALRSGGIALMADGRADQLLQAIRNNQAFDAALAGKRAMPRPFTALDLVRGYRIDIFSSQTNQWYSLHRRDETYTFGPSADPVLHRDDQEGFTQLGVASPAEDPKRHVDKAAKAAGAPQPGTDMHAHERVARWTGWSLSAQRPGKALNRDADPAKALDSDPTTNEPVTPFKMNTSFTAVSRSLPRLRFGVRYRMRVRTVDLAGNSVALSQAAPRNIELPSGTDLPYLRFEPVAQPIMLLVEPLKQGASLETMVIRSYNHDISLDGVPTLENDHRHIMPPRTAVRMVEHHGMLDNAAGQLKGDAATYGMLVSRDAAEYPTVNKVPMDQNAQAMVNYLPDPISRGAAFRNLPNTRSNTDGVIVQGALAYSISPQVEWRAGSVTHVGFGTDWPNRLPFRMVIAEGYNKPKWDAQQRVLAVYLRKAAFTQVALSSYVDPGDLSLMGVWDWLRQYLEFAELESISNGGPVYPSDGMAKLTQLTLEGGHPMITPARTVTLVHATQQPIGRPEFQMLPVVRPAGQSQALANSFSPIAAWRDYDSHSAVLLGGLHIHGASTSQVDIEANWREFVDDTSQPGPQQLPATAHVERYEMTSLSGGLMYADALQTRAIGTYIPQGDTLWFSAPGDTIPGMSAPNLVAAPKHVFTDTKHRRAQYQAISTSRFQEYFPEPNLTFTRSSDKKIVNIPSSARPSTPDVKYVVPVFGYEEQETTNVRTIVRRGNGVRVYLGRPWYSSGESELLGVLLWNPGTTLTTDLREKYKNYFTQWGMDPIWKTESLTESPGTNDLTLAVATATLRTLEETDLRVDVAGHCVFYDPQRQLWYCDIVFDNYSAYGAFVRMSLARYQPHSLNGVELSHAVLADFVQLSPDRSAVLSIDPANPRTARVFVGGLTPEGPRPLRHVVNVERRMAGVYSDAGWEAAPASVVTVVEEAVGSGSVDEVLWAGILSFNQMPPKDQYRVVIREYETLPVDPTVTVSTLAEVGAFGERLIYAAIIPYDFPQ
jgi:hypothetical protein